jgi:hypothetical protein
VPGFFAPVNAQIRAGHKRSLTGCRSDLQFPLLIRGNYQNIQHDQEDWGCFIWFREGGTKLAVDIFCDDPKTGMYRVFLTSRPLVADSVEKL